MKKWYSIIVFMVFFPCIAQGKMDIPSSELSRRAETVKRLETIETALARYASTYTRIPCPAESGASPENPIFGQESTATDDCSNPSDPSSGNVFAGTLPVRTLHLDDRYMLDGWGRRFTYVVDQRFANRGVKATDLAGNESSYLSTIKSDIEIRDTIGGNILYNGIDDRIVALVISHGANGHGAYTFTGNRIDAGVTDADELANSHYHGGGSFDPLFIQKEPTATFDDLVVVFRRSTDIDLFCPGYGATVSTGGSTPDNGLGYPAYNWPGVNIGQTATKECLPGYVGEVKRDCTNTATEAVWDTAPPDPESTCQCPELPNDSGDGYGNTTWQATTPAPAPGTMVTKACGSPTSDPLYSGLYSGTVTRNCVGDGTIWAPAVSNCTCNEAVLSGPGYAAVTFPAGVPVGGTSTQECSGGDVTATCQPSGGWQVTANSCNPGL